MKFYDEKWRTVFIFTMLICFWPIGVYSMWKMKEGWPAVIKWGITVIFIIVSIKAYFYYDANM